MVEHTENLRRLDIRPAVTGVEEVTGGLVEILFTPSENPRVVVIIGAF
jgi:hypothetical protein